MKPGISVYVLAGRQLFAEALGIALSLHPEIHVSGAHSDARLGLAGICETRPAVVLLDRVQAEVNGTQLTSLLLTELPDTKVLVLASAVQNEDLLACVEAGVAGYITRDVDPAELVLAIKRVHAGEAVFPPDLLLKLLKRTPDEVEATAEPEGINALSPNQINALSVREREVLQVLAAGLSTAEAANRLSITPHTLRTHLKNVMLKLHARSKLEAVLCALKHGIITLPS